MEYLGFDVGYGWWKPAASKMQAPQDMQIRDDPKEGLQNVRSFVGACNFIGVISTISLAPLPLSQT